VSSTALVHLRRNRYSVPSEHAHEVESLWLYRALQEVVAENHARGQPCAQLRAQALLNRLTHHCHIVEMSNANWGNQHPAGRSVRTGPPLRHTLSWVKVARRARSLLLA
jgi:hypothetical protein